ncbi:MAG: hypothetical protein WCG25_00600 [bacterium]
MLFFSIVSGIQPTAYVAIVEISITADNKNRLACMSIPAIKIFLTIQTTIVLSIHLTLKRLFNMLNNKINHNA